MHKIYCNRCKLKCPVTEFTSKARRLGYGWCKPCRKARSLAVKNRHTQEAQVLTPYASEVVVRHVEPTLTGEQAAEAARKRARVRYAMKNGTGSPDFERPIGNSEFGSLRRNGKGNVHGFRK